jgi:hypothetical protein
MQSNLARYAVHFMAKLVLTKPNETRLVMTEIAYVQIGVCVGHLNLN